MAEKKPQEQTEDLKLKVNANKDTYFVDKSTSIENILKADKAKRKLIFDITDFPEINPSELNKLSKANRMAYTMDARYAVRAGERINAGESPYSDVDAPIKMVDPLAAGHVQDKFTVENKKKGMKYIFPHAGKTSRLIRAGYEHVKADDPETVASGSEIGGKMFIKDNKGNAEHAVLRVPQEAYDKHIAFYGQKSKERLGVQNEKTAEKLKRYAPRVNVYDKSKLTK